MGGTREEITRDEIGMAGCPSRARPARLGKGCPSQGPLSRKCEGQGLGLCNGAGLYLEQAVRSDLPDANYTDRESGPIPTIEATDEH